jgi:ABC-type antimicrobial peptide transport system permease subunit
MAFAVTQRTREIGIRMAVGARRSAVMKLVIGQSLVLAAAGVALGLGARLQRLTCQPAGPASSSQ